jgi:glycosyltransferase involved in cell wall biosynthesis
MNKLSVVIITFNEEENIASCIDSAREVADEVVVVDSFSTDNTCSIAAGKGAKVLQHKFDGHIEQKNWAKDQAANSFVLSLDADERLSAGLREAIKRAKQNFLYDGYTMNRLNFYCGRAIKTCGWYPDAKLRLWNKSMGQWSGINPHDKFELDSGGKKAHLQGDLLHYTFPNRQSFLSQVEKFAGISALYLKDRNVFYLFAKMIFSAPFKFARNYFFNLGFTEGFTGLFICYHQSREVYLKYWMALKMKYAGAF